jgi:hypothetical protein
MTPNNMPTKLVKAVRKQRGPRPIRNNQLADALRQKGVAK